MQDSNPTTSQETAKPKFFVYNWGIKDVEPMLRDVNGVKDLIEMDFGDFYPSLDQCIDNKYDGLITADLDPNDVNIRAEFTGYFLHEKKPIVVLNLMGGGLNHILAHYTFGTPSSFIPLDYKVAHVSKEPSEKNHLKQIIEELIQNK